MKTRIYICFLVLFLSYSLVAPTHYFIQYGVAGEGRLMVQFLYDTPPQDRFYVDIGAYDSIFASNTLNLHTLGWKGVNVQANPHRHKNLLLLRPDGINVNYAIGQDNKFSILHQMQEDSSSTLSDNVAKYAQSSRPQVQQILVATISMKTLCQNYYIKRPVFMNLDIEGYGSQALKTNDWSNPICRPSIILAENNQFSKVSGFPEIQNVLSKQNYTKLPKRVGLNEVYISNDVLNQYKEIQQSNQEQLDIQSINLLKIMRGLAHELETKTEFVPHYDVRTDGIYYHFSVEGELILVSQLIKKSQGYYEKPQVRPIVICNFNPKMSQLAIDKAYRYEQSKYKREQIEFFNITVKAFQTYSIFVFDHRISPPQDFLKLNIVNSRVRGYSSSSKGFDDGDTENTVDEVTIKLSNMQTMIGSQIKDRKIHQKIMGQKFHQLENQLLAITKQIKEAEGSRVARYSQQESESMNKQQLFSEVRVALFCILGLVLVSNIAICWMLVKMKQEEKHKTQVAAAETESAL